MLGYLSCRKLALAPWEGPIPPGGANTTRRSGSDPHCWQDYPKETRGHRRVRMTQTVMPSVNSNVFLRQYQYCNKRKVRLTFLTRLSDTDHHRPRQLSRTLVPSVTRRLLLLTLPRLLPLLRRVLGDDHADTLASAVRARRLGCAGKPCTSAPGRPLLAYTLPGGRLAGNRYRQRMHVARAQLSRGPLECARVP